MTIWTIVSPFFLVANHSANAGTLPIPTYDLAMAAIATLAWAIALAMVASRIRTKEILAARAHIRSIRFARRDTGAVRPDTQPPASNNRRAYRHGWIRPLPNE
jgi:hypothetical protein